MAEGQAPPQVVVGGDAYGSGSSREHAPENLQLLGPAGVVDQHLEREAVELGRILEDAPLNGAFESLLIALAGGVLGCIAVLPLNDLRAGEVRDPGGRVLWSWGPPIQEAIELYEGRDRLIGRLTDLIG